MIEPGWSPQAFHAMPCLLLLLLSLPWWWWVVVAQLRSKYLSKIKAKAGSRAVAAVQQHAGSSGMTAAGGEEGGGLDTRSRGRQA